MAITAGRVTRLLLIALAAGIATLLVAAAVLRALLIDYRDPGHQRVAEAGFQHRTAAVNDVAFHFLEGPDNGPPLVLLHAQLMEWLSYSRVMPDLSESFHVFAIDYPGHGATTYPAGYPMTAARLGADLGDLLRNVVGEPAFVTGNSSGGLLTAWLAANRPDLVRAIVLEDPPLFSAEYPRVRETVAYRSFVTSQNYLESGASDFLSYWIESNAAFFDNNVFPGAGSLLQRAVTTYREANPGDPVELRFLPNDTVRLLVRGLGRYDPRFGAAFFDGSWHDGFDHGETLARITCPALLIHADFEIREDGTLAGAMSQDEADRAAALLRDGRYLRLAAPHVVHLDRPAEFAAILRDFFLD